MLKFIRTLLALPFGISAALLLFLWLGLAVISNFIMFKPEKAKLRLRILSLGFIETANTINEGDKLYEKEQASRSSN